MPFVVEKVAISSLIHFQMHTPVNERIKDSGLNGVRFVFVLQDRFCKPKRFVDGWVSIT